MLDDFEPCVCVTVTKEECLYSAKEYSRASRIDHPKFLYPEVHLESNEPPNLVIKSVGVGGIKGMADAVAVDEPSVKTDCTVETPREIKKQYVCLRVLYGRPSG